MEAPVTAASIFFTLAGSRRRRNELRAAGLDADEEDNGGGLV
jgi:hypothetical protein